MSKRLRDSGSYDDPFVRRLSSAHKHLWFYILDKCDHAGIWKVDLELASFFTGSALNRQEAETALAEKVEFLDDKTWFIPGFIVFQYGFLNDENRIHRSVLALLASKGLEAPSKSLVKPLQDAKVKNKVKDKVKAKAKVDLDLGTDLEISKSITSSADAEGKARVAAEYKKQAKELQDYFFAAYERVFKKKLTWQHGKHLTEKAIALLQAQGMTDAKRLADNYLASTYITSPNWRAFLSNPDAYQVPMLKRFQGPKGEYSPKPRGQEEVPSYIAALAKGLPKK